jgi:trans-2,3-dihydro-3-hydroxyanthranilate isomerase
VFTATPLAGNGLAVVHGADGLDDATMLAFARETRLSETTFIQSAQTATADYRNRIWMTTGELPFAGHPSLGTAVAVAHERGETEAQYVQQTPAGEQPIDIRLDGRTAHASMLQEPAVFADELDPALVLAVAGLDARYAVEGLPPQPVSTGLRHIVAPVRDLDALARAQPDALALSALLRETDSVVLYLAVVDAEAGTVRARSFLHGLNGVEEDPATGSAAGPLCAYLHRRLGLDGVTIAQGVEMGRPSELRASVEGDRVRVGGAAVIVAEGTLFL